jgi:hypothetical protein
MGMTVASFVISAVALVVAAVAAWYGRGQKRTADRSAAEAKRSADAAAEVAAIERGRRADEVADADRRRVCFELVSEGNHAYLLRNTGTDTAYGVHVDTGGMGLEDEIADFEEFESGREQRYWFIRKGGPEGSKQPEHIVSPGTTVLIGPMRRSQRSCLARRHV